MKKNVLVIVMSLSPALCAGAQTVSDSLLVERLEDAVVQGVRVQKNAPYAVANVGETALKQFSLSGRELPFLLSRTPGVLAWSENGVGTGTSHMRIRGAGDSRINVTVDGVPLNSPEDQCVFWANMNSYAGYMESVQLQRGVGASTNGDGAFGGSVAMKTKSPSLVPYAEVSASYGSYNTLNLGVSASTGLLWNRFVAEGGYHRTSTDGYVDGTAGRSGSYYAGLTWLGGDFTIRYRNIGNFEHTGQAWNGVTAGSDDLSLMDGTYGASTGIRSYADMCRVGLGRYNSLYERLATDSWGKFIIGPDGKYQTVRYSLKDGSLWPRTTDNFIQDHNILSASWNIDGHWNTSLSLRYTYGYGYYEEFRYNNKLSKFGLSCTLPDGSTLSRTDFIRRKGLDQNTFGAVYNLRYRDSRWDVIGGLTAQRFTSGHFGYLTYIADDYLASSVLDSDGHYSYYDSDAFKGDYSAFVKAALSLGEHWDVFGDLQYRRVDYRTGGRNDKFIKQADGTYANQTLDIDEHYGFFNPKGGVSYVDGPHRAYASVAVSHREPERNNFTDNGGYPAPKAESLIDYELGYQLGLRQFRAGINLYYMDYRDQFVQTGQTSDIGEKLTTNIARSYRAGAEITLSLDAAAWLTLEGNAALSANRILDFDEYAEDWAKGYRVIHYDSSILAFSPGAILNGFADFRFGDFSAVWHSAYVSRQYLDNTADKDRSLPAYSFSELNLAYTFRFSGALKELRLGLDFGNIFNSRYATSGWVYSAISEADGHPDGNRYYQIGFIPAAGFTALGNVVLRF